MNRLDVYMNNVLVGALERERSGVLKFTYDPNWLTRGRPLPISRCFPLREKPYLGQSISDYFENLLPEDRRVRELLAARAQASGIRAFDLLRVIGRDCVGALQLFPAGSEPEPVGSIQGRPLRDREVAEIIRNLRVNPLGIDPEQDFRISLAGAQSKTALLRQGGKWLLPKGSTPTTHILKPAIGKLPDGPDFSLSVENEWLCLTLIRAFGLQAAKPEIVDFDGLRVLAIERFDRSWSGRRLYRLPQEDLCQALGVPPGKKYQADGGPGIGRILDLLNESDDRDGDRYRFMKAQVVFWLMAAIDGHAKNFSLFIRPSGFVMTPFYDVMSADPHLDPRYLPLQRIKLAMSVGKSRHYKIEEIQSRHWLQTAANSKFSEMEKVFEDVARDTPQVIQSVAGGLPKGFPLEVSDLIFAGIQRRLKRLTGK